MLVTSKASDECNAPTPVIQVCDTFPVFFGMRRNTVRSEILNPSFFNSPCIRGAPQIGLAFDMVWMSFRSAWRYESAVIYSENHLFESQIGFGDPQGHQKKTPRVASRGRWDGGGNRLQIVSADSA
jgi:hypothetical protein